MAPMRELSRRQWMSVAAAALASAPAARSAKSGLKIAIFSKHLRFLEGEALAKGAAEIGFDGIDLAVRKGGHVEPARVAADLPKLVAIIRQHGLEVPMITTDIVDDRTPFAADILRVCADLNIHHYRWGGFKYDGKQPFNAQLDALKPRIAALAAINRRYATTAMYHTHSGVGVVGASIWDLREVLRDFDPRQVGINYDIGHATVEGGFGGWINSFLAAGPYVRGIAVKDFLWEKDQAGNWRPAWKPLGQGMVRLPQFLAMVKQAAFDGPLQIHFEYPLGGADGGKPTLTIPKEEVFAAMKRDVATLRGYLSAAGLA